MSVWITSNMPRLGNKHAGASKHQLNVKKYMDLANLNRMVTATAFTQSGFRYSIGQVHTFCTLSLTIFIQSWSLALFILVNKISSALFFKKCVNARPREIWAGWILPCWNAPRLCIVSRFTVIVSIICSALTFVGLLAEVVFDLLTEHQHAQMRVRSFVHGFGLDAHAVLFWR